MKTLLRILSLQRIAATPAPQNPPRAKRGSHASLGWAALMFTVMLLSPEMAAADFFDNVGTLTCKVAGTMTGPIAAALAVIAIASFGAMMAFTEVNGVVKSMSGIILGVVIAMSAPAIIQATTGKDVLSSCSGMIR